ncbi:extracellular solute-binding protein [Spirochaeta dissipatitropha]
MKQTNFRFLSAAAIVTLILLTVFFVLRPVDREIPEPDEAQRLWAYLLLLEDLPEQNQDYLEYMRRYDTSDEMARSRTGASIQLIEPGTILELGSEDLIVQFEVEQSGLYTPALRYRRTDSGLSNTSLDIRVNGVHPFTESRALELTRRWVDESKHFTRDRYNDESLPLQLPVQDWIDKYLYDISGRLIQPIQFHLDRGINEFAIRNDSAYNLELEEISLETVIKPESYLEYSRDRTVSLDNIQLAVNAIDYSSKNAYNVRMGSSNDPAATPFHPVDRLLNTIEASSWARAGDEIAYQITVPRDGWYALTLRYNNPNNDFSVFRSIRLNGEIPFREFMAYEFPARGAVRWEHHTLADETGEPYYLYLPAGEHEISLKAEKEPVTEAVRALNMIISHMNFFGIEIMKVTGRDIDRNRTWRLTDFIHKTADYLDAYTILLSDIIWNLSAYSSKGMESAVVSGLHTALFKLEKLAEKPDELPMYLQDIYSTSIYDRPVTQILGETVNMLENTAMGIDMLYFETQPSEHWRSANVMQHIHSSMRSLVATYTGDKYRTDPSDDVLDVWVTRPITHTDLMQKMADADFTARTGIPVRISVMPEFNRLILATAANRTPDLAMGLPSFIPFDLAIRGAVLELSEFDDFWEFASSFSPGAFIPYILNESVYGMPETLDFHALIYRTDIFRQLQLSPPDTWQDVIEMLPELQRFGMNFYHPIAGGLPTLKWFYQTSPFVYQFGGSLYAEDGLSVNLDDPKTLEGLRFLSELFSLYALQEQVPIFYNSFRFGVLPVGIVDSVTYLQLKYAAPELKGQWALAPYPGTPDVHGDPQRWFIANGVSAVIMKDTPMPDESWEFMKWWLSAETQADFGYRLQSTYGPEYLWFSANLDALADAPIEARDKQIILDQVRWQRDVPRTPAQYMLERGLSDIWINSATRNRSLRTEVDTMIPVIDREVTRKMTEFGFIDSEGNVLKPFIVPEMDWILSKFASYLEGDSDG